MRARHCMASVCRLRSTSPSGRFGVCAADALHRPLTGEPAHDPRALDEKKTALYDIAVDQGERAPAPSARGPGIWNPQRLRLTRGATLS